MSDAFDLIVVGSGAAGMMAAITAARAQKSVLILEKLSKPGAKLKATGGGRCNLTNTLDNVTFMEHFGRNGRFMQNALEAFDQQALRTFYQEIGVETHAPDGFRVFPKTHNSETILTALEKELERLHVTLLCATKVTALLHDTKGVTGVTCNEHSFYAPHIIIATGGLGYPQLGAEGDGHELAKATGHRITPLYPAMMPLHVKEEWVANCRADTIAKAQIRIALKKGKSFSATGDLIFTKNGIRGPVVLDFAREITPLLEKHAEVPILVNMTKGMNEDSILKHLKTEHSKAPRSVIELVSTLLPEALSRELCLLSGVEPDTIFSKLEGAKRELLVKNIAWTPLHVTGHDGFKMAMITRGGVSLKEIDPSTMASKKLKGVYFCGEVMDLDGPCGGYNLQWSFASGFIAGHLYS